MAGTGASRRSLFSEHNLTILSAVLSGICLMLAIQILIFRPGGEDRRYVPDAVPERAVVWTRVLAGGAVVALYDPAAQDPAGGRCPEEMALALGGPAEEFTLLELLLVGGAREGESLEVGHGPRVRISGGSLSEPVEMVPIGDLVRSTDDLPSGTRLLTQQLGSMGEAAVVPAGRAKRLVLGLARQVDLTSIEAVEAILAGAPVALERQLVAPGDLEDIIQRARRDSLR